MAVVRQMKLDVNASDVFWGEIAPCEHMVQIYDENQVLLDTLEGFAASGLRAGESVIVIATAGHLEGLAQRLTAAGIDLPAARAADQYIALDAERTLGQFMVGGMPDDLRFRTLVTGLIGRAKTGGRKVRAFGEMVAVLWAHGDRAAVMRLEQLWHEICSAQLFSLLCAYPRSGFTQDTHRSIAQIQAAHSRTVSGVSAVHAARARKLADAQDQGSIPS
jgi:hypothetical protein